MARDHRKLRVFQEAHQLTLAMYKETRNFPKDEWFGLRAQIRRASVSMSSNLVEGSARRTTREYLNFCNIARASAAEVAYLVDLSFELSLFTREQHGRLRDAYTRLLPQMESLVQHIELLMAEEETARRLKPANPDPKPKAQSPKPRAQSPKPRAQSPEPRA